MKIQDTDTPGNILIDCMNCGAMFPVPDFRDGDLADTMQKCYESCRLCEKCTKAAEQEKLRQKQEAHRAERIARLPQLLEAAGIEYLYSHDRSSGKLFAEPPCRYAAAWIYRHRRENLLISGITGSGKSTSACFIAAGLIREEYKVRYTTLRKLLSDWRAAKTSDRDYAVEEMLRNIFHKDYFIIDEVVGKARVSESGQELLFEILESVNSGACHAKIWLLGNFYTGSIEEIFSDPEPVRRRIQENFSCVVLDRTRQTVTPITVWKEQKQ